MKETITKILFQSSAPIFLLLTIFSVFLTPCSGQENETSQNAKIIESDTPAIESQTYFFSNMDHLFYIEGQVCAWVRMIHQDKSGNLWFSTNHYGVMRYNGDTLEYFDAKQGLGIGRKTEIVEDKEGNLWFGTAGGLSKYDGKTFTNFSRKNGLANEEIWTVIQDKKGIFWIGTMEGVFQFDGQVFTPFPIPKATVSDTSSILSYNRITSIMEDRNGAIWFGTDGFGICKYDPSNTAEPFTHFTKKDGLCDNNVHGITEDSKGNIWIGSMYGGISRYDGKSFTNFTQDGLVEGMEAGGFYEDKNGNIWFAAENHGVYRYDGVSFTNFNARDGLNTNGVICIFEDREGRFWLGGWGGLFRFDGKSFFPVTKTGPWK